MCWPFATQPDGERSLVDEQQTFLMAQKLLFRLCASMSWLFSHFIPVARQIRGETEQNDMYFARATTALFY